MSDCTKCSLYWQLLAPLKHVSSYHKLSSAHISVISSLWLPSAIVSQFLARCTRYEDALGEEIVCCRVVTVTWHLPFTLDWFSILHRFWDTGCTCGWFLWWCVFLPYFVHIVIIQIAVNSSIPDSEVSAFLWLATFFDQVPRKCIKKKLRFFEVNRSKVVKNLCFPNRI